MRQFDLTPIAARRSVSTACSTCSKPARASRPRTIIRPLTSKRIADDRYRITLAVAGFGREEIEITAQQNLLQVKGNKAEKEGSTATFLHLGIANRSFERRFELADFVRVDDARLNDGLLTIELVREVPEAMKPKTIAIKTGAPLTAVEGGKDSEAA